MEALHFLIIDDDVLVQAALSSALRRYGPCAMALSCASGERELHKDWDGFLIDVRLGDGSGLDVLATARRRGIRTPAVVLSGALDHEAINGAAKLDARLVAKPCGTSELAPFVAEVLFRKTNDRAFAARERARHRFCLTDREVDIIGHALRGKTRDDYIQSSGMTRNTFKTHVRRLLQKSRYDSLSALAIDLLNEH